MLKNGRLYYALAGNCRIAVYRNADLIPLSEGHTIDVLAKGAFQRKQITRSEVLAALKEKRVYNTVGHDGFRDIEMFDVPVILKPGDIIVLMTDGVYEFRTTGQLEDILGSPQDCAQKARQIIDDLEKANHPEQDNATVILIKMEN